MEGVQREHGGVQMCVERCAIVCRRCARCMQVCKRHGRGHNWARRCAEGCAGGARAWAEWGGGAGVVGAGPVQRKSKVENFRKIFESVPVLTGLTTKI